MTTSEPASVQVRDLQKQYAVHEKEPGLLGSVKAFVSRKTRYVDAVKGVTFDLASLLGGIRAGQSYPEFAPSLDKAVEGKPESTEN